MGCFNTKGFFSKIDLEYNDKAFVLVCAQYGEPIEFKPGKEHNFVPTGSMYPITFPIFGEYDDYGRITNIQEDFNTWKLESIIGDSTKNFLDLLYEVTVFPRHLDQKDIDRYIDYKQKLGIYPGSFPGHVYNNQELIWTMDHEFVYKTLGSVYFDYISQTFARHKSDLFGSCRSLCCDFKKVWGDDVFEYENEVRQFLSFVWYFDVNYLSLSQSYCTNQDIEWDGIATYTNALNEFIQKKQRGEI